MPKTLTGVMDFDQAQAAVQELASAGVALEDISVLVTATVADEGLAARAADILHRRHGIENPVSAANQAALNERVYYAEERAAAAHSTGGPYDGPDRRVSGAPHGGTERRRMI